MLAPLADVVVIMLIICVFLLLTCWAYDTVGHRIEAGGMTVTIYIVTSRRDPAVFWGHEKQSHATRESAEAACHRLNAKGGCGRDEPPEYEVEEWTRANFTRDEFGEEEWEAACREAGVVLETGTVLSTPSDRRRSHELPSISG
jgi:hypothetical protein